jgi:ABC-type glycerol-3-phosphate transport system substrate-binding protein
METVELWHDKGQNPNWNPAFEATMPQLNELIEGNFQVEAVPYQSTDSYQGALRPVLGSNDGPAAFTWWTGARLRNVANDGYAQDITDVWNERVEAGQYTESMMETFSVDGTAYGIPSQLAYWPVWYNTETFDDLGVEAPSTWSEFTDLCDTIVAESDDTDPIAMPLGPNWTGFIWFEEILVKQDPEFYNTLCRGEAQYTDDQTLDALTTIREMADDGYFGDANSAFSMGLDDLPNLMENGDYAMMLMGSWISGSWTGDLDFGKYDWFALPPLDDSLGDQLIIEPGPFVPHSGHEDTDQVTELADKLLSTEFQQAWNEEQGFIPANTEVDTSYLSETKASLADAVASGDYTFPLRYWENTSPDVAVPASSALAQIYDPSRASPQSVAEELESLRQDVYGDV